MAGESTIRAGGLVRDGKLEKKSQTIEINIPGSISVITSSFFLKINQSKIGNRL